MAQRTKYRKWTDPEGTYIDNFLMIRPDGIMTQISFRDDGVYGVECIIYRTRPLNPVNDKVFLKHKEFCSKSEWNEAKKRVENYLKN